MGVYLVCLIEPNQLDRPDRPDPPDRLKTPCLDDVIEAVDIEPMTCRIEHSNWILPVTGSTSTASMMLSRQGVFSLSGGSGLSRLSGLVQKINPQTR